MNLNHLNLPVPDVAEATQFFEQQLGFRVLGRNPGLTLLRDPQGLLLGLSNFRGTKSVTYPPDFHLGFDLGSRAAVDQMHAQLTAAGYNAGRLPAPMHGSYSFYFEAFGCLTIEFTVWENDPEAPQQ